ncbi:MAG: hypothetical protein U0270_08205 [Labilithrix sp.]
MPLVVAVTSNDAFLLVVPKAALLGLLNALARRADGPSAFWFPIEEELADHADDTRRTGGRLEGRVEDTTLHVRRGVFYAVVSISAAAPEHDELFAESLLVRQDLLRVAREAGGGIVLHARVPGAEYERVDRKTILAIDTPVTSVDAFAEAAGIGELPPPSRRR